MSYYKTKDNINIYYEVKGEGKPIVFIHGFGESQDSFRIQKRALSKKYKVVTYDIRGHGLSDKVDYGLNMERFALDLKELIEYLELKDIVLVGWSMGAYVIFEYINLFGEDNLSKICIIDKGPKTLNDHSWDLGLYNGEYTMEDGLKDLELIKNNFMEFGRKFIKRMTPYFDEKQIEIGLNRIMKNEPAILYKIWEDMIQRDYRPSLEKITIPALIVFGGKSTFYSIEAGEYLKDNIKDSKLVIFHDCTHLLVLENPIKFNRVLEEFINNKNHNL